METTSANPAVGTYSTLYIKTDGDYFYTLDNDDLDTDESDDGDAGKDVFEVTVNDTDKTKVDIRYNLTFGLRGTFQVSLKGHPNRRCRSLCAGPFPGFRNSSSGAPPVNSGHVPASGLLRSYPHSYGGGLWIAFPFGDY